MFVLTSPVQILLVEASHGEIEVVQLDDIHHNRYPVVAVCLDVTGV